MSGFASLSRLGATFRPIDVWPAEQTRSRRRSQFESGLSSTVELLTREVRALNGRLIVIQKELLSA